MQPQDPAPYAFLFNADWPGFGGSYGDPINQAFFEAVLAADPLGEASFRVREGDLFFHTLVNGVAEVGTKEGAGGVSTYYSLTVGPRRASAVMFEFCDIEGESWFSFDDENLPLQLVIGNTHVVCVSECNEQLRNDIDRYLKRSPFYLGAFLVDLGNPLIRDRLVSNLIYQHYYARRNLGFTWELAALPEEQFALANSGGWWQRLPFTEVYWHDEERDEPPDFSIVPNTRRGDQTAALLNSVRSPTLKERLARSLLEASLQEQVHAGEVVAFSTRTTELPHAEIPSDKLTGYCLNDQHPVGRDKAKLFKDLLGIGASDWRYLAVQLMEGVELGEVHKARFSPYGVKFHVDVMISGLNGAIKPVRSAWISLNGETPRLVTAYVAEEGFEGESLPPPPSITPVRDKYGPELWRSIYDQAHARGVDAAQNCIPRAMVVDKQWVVREGKVGFAWIVIPDGRRAFGRWLRSEGFGELVPGKGTFVFAGTSEQSVDRAEAYANAFSRVLFLNGIDNRVFIQLD